MQNTDPLLGLFFMPKFAAHSDPAGNSGSSESPAQAQAPNLSLPSGAISAISTIRAPKLTFRRSLPKRWRNHHRPRQRPDYQQIFSYALNRSAARQRIATFCHDRMAGAAPITGAAPIDAASSPNAHRSHSTPSAPNASRSPTTPGPHKPLGLRPCSPDAEPLSDAFMTIKAPQSLGRQHLAPSRSSTPITTSEARTTIAIV